MADVKPFRAERYDEEKAGPLDRLVAPPYDVISPAEREDYLARSPYNVVHLTLPDDEEQAVRDLAAWRGEGVLSREEEPAAWVLSQDYTGPGRRPREPARASSPRSARSRTRTASCSRTSARTAVRRRDGCGC